ncbi:MAG: HAD family phosphatase [Anaerolineae bacterium]|nr:HAD family phosphatase [Anaerolineae bacterium]
MSETTIRAIAVDIDGTLLNSKHKLTPEVEKALHDAAGQGVHIILATGKSRNSAIHLIKQLKLATSGIYLQGTTIYDESGKITHQKVLDPDLVRRVITYAEDRDFAVIAYSGTRIMARHEDKEMRESTEKYHEPAPEVVGSLQAIAGTLPINKIMMIGEPRAITSLRWQLGFQLGGSARLVQAGLSNMLEMLPLNSGKGPALETLLQDMNISPKEVMAIGDAENDIEMLKLVGVGIAMGQAAQMVKDAAAHITATNDDHGVARAIEKFVLKPTPTAEAFIEEAATTVIRITPPAQTNGDS